MTLTYSRNLEREWRECCMNSLGFKCVNLGEHNNEEAKEGNERIILMNLLNDCDGFKFEEEETQSADTWMQNAKRISDGILHIENMLQQNRDIYLEPLTDESNSLLESTILSFVATTANQIEALQKSVSSPNKDYSHHCQGIVSFLLAKLKEDVANPFSVLQKKRTRDAMSLWEAPLQCQLACRAKETRFDRLEEKADQLFSPESHLRPCGAGSFMSTYEEPESFSPLDLQRPNSILNSKKRVSNFSSKSKQKHDNKSERIPLQNIIPVNDGQIEEEYHSHLQREAALLTVSLQNDLDSVHRVEASMSEITRLLAQFSDLVTEQQAEISNIHDTTVESHRNVEKGQDHLVDATERTKKSKHYMASAIFAMALLLLFFNQF
mmetsp:Transcript_30866/g.46860  ORF Transcript_30866/g.46860 Transcript_30866/m.46860 type:complete len:380 (-) Transcript_30866:173-1312(-)